MSATYAIFAFQLVAFIILVALMHDLYRKLRRDDVRPAAPAGPDAAQMRAAVDEMVAELRRAADRINADIVARASTLQKLVDEADQRLRTLDAALARSDAGRPVAARPIQRQSSAARPIEPPAPTPERPTSAPSPSLQTAERPTERAARAPAASLLPLGEGQEEGVAPERRPTPRPSVRPHPDPLPEGEGTSTRPPAPIGRPAEGSDSWPGAPASQPTRTMPRVAPAAGAAGSAYRQAARTGGSPSQADGAGEAEARSRADEFVELGLDDTGKFQAVRRLADQGLSAAEIARQTRLGREEVELIMQLSGEARQ